MTAAELLTAARDLYASAPSHCAADDVPEAGTYCGITALSAADKRGVHWTTRHVFDAAWDALKAASHEMTGYTTIVDLVAEQSTETVVAVFDRAIQSVQS